MAKSKYKRGDKLRIRQWEDMVEEFGIEGDRIPCMFGFYNVMKYLCGAEFTVKSISRIRETYKYSSTERVESGEFSPFGGNGWTISADMLEPIDSPIEIASSKSFNEMLI